MQSKSVFLHSELNLECEIIGLTRIQAVNLANANQIEADDVKFVKTVICQFDLTDLQKSNATIDKSVNEDDSDLSAVIANNGVMVCYSNHLINNDIGNRKFSGCVYPLMVKSILTLDSEFDDIFLSESSGNKPLNLQTIDKPIYHYAVKWRQYAYSYSQWHYKRFVTIGCAIDYANSIKYSEFKYYSRHYDFDSAVFEANGYFTFAKMTIESSGSNDYVLQMTKLI